MLGEFEKVGLRGWGVVLRVPLLYGEVERRAESAVNVLMGVVERAKEGAKGVRMDHWAVRYPTNTEDVGRVCQGMLFVFHSHQTIFIPRPTRQTRSLY